MDYSSLTENHQQQQQQQYQQHEASAAAVAAPAAYDPSLSYDGYYSYPQQPQSQHYEYDPSAAAAYQYQQQHYDYYSTQTHPQPDPPAAGPTAQIHAPGTPAPYPLPAGMNPAAASAVAALSQLSEYAGSMAERQWQHHQRFNPHHYLTEQQAHPAIRPVGGGGRRGAAPFRGGGRRGRGGGRGNPSHHPPRQEGGAAPSFPGRGRGRGRGRTGRGAGPKPHQSATDPQPAHSAAAAFAGQSSNPSGDQQAAPFIHPKQPVLPIAWCDICRADCNSMEVLEQHKNGKRHKKTVQKIEEIRKRQKLLGEQHPDVNPDMFTTTLTVNTADLSSESKPTPAFSAVNTGNLNSESNQAVALTAEQSSQPEGQLEPANVDPSSTASGTEEPLSEGLVMKQEGTKRKITQLGRGGKRLKGFESARGKALGPRERPIVCTLCNVMCDTFAVFESHLAGKKHLSKIRQFQVRGSTFGPITVYIPPNQPSAYPTKGLEPLFFGLKSQEMVQQETYARLNGLRAVNVGIQELEATRGMDFPDGVVVPAAEKQDDAQMGNNSESQAALDCQSDEPTQLTDTAILGTEVALRSTEDVVPLPEFESTVVDDVVIPGIVDSGAASL